MSLSALEVEYLRSHFAELLLSLADLSALDEFNPLWSAMEENYGQSRRYYHTLRHIFHLMQHFNANKDLFSSAEVQTIVQLSIFYHDIIYDPLSMTNEDDSAVFFRDNYCSFLPPTITTKILDYIIATKYHKQNAETTTDPDLKLFLDMDLSILASEPTEYAEYARNIRQEYISYDDNAYRQGRIKVLETFLGLNEEKECWIFASEHFRILWEAKAKNNLQNELNKLQAGEFM